MGILNFWKTYGILGINARNLHYLALNARDAVRMADDKLKTKSFLSAREINVPRLLGRISNQEELHKFNWKSLPDDFVLKPNHGYGGEGILALEKDGDAFKTIGKEKPLSLEELKIHIGDIIEGKFSLGGFHDEAFFEQRLVLHHELLKLTPAGGLPDVRIIYYNLVPVMAMLRLPTRASGGKANTHLGGVGVGIDLATGKTTYATQYNRFVEEIPEVGPPSRYTIPGFDEMLLMGARIQQSVSLGYLAVDFVPDENTGPTLLEINARAGLMAQVANRSPLRNRLNRIRGIKVGSAEKGVQIGRDLFSEKKVHHIKKEKEELQNIVGLMEEVELILPHGSERVLAKIKPDADKTYVDTQILENIKHGLEEAGESTENFLLKFVLGGKRHRVVPTARHLRGDYDLIIGAKKLSDILIDPAKKFEKKKPNIAPPKENVKKTSTIDKLLEIDKSLSKIDQDIKVLYYLKPENLEEEKKKFFEKNNYNPKFNYRPLNFNSEEYLKKIQEIKIDLNFPGATIFLEKQKEMTNKLLLFESRGKPDFTEKSEALYAKLRPEILKQAHANLKKYDLPNEDKKEAFSSSELVDVFKTEIEKFNLTSWEAKEAEMVADCMVSQRNRKISVRKGAVFSKDRVAKLLLHEFYTHALRAINGEYQPYQIFRFGMANYLKTDEGLAIYNQIHFRKKERPQDIFRASFIYAAVDVALKGNFRDVFNFAKENGADDEYAFQVALKTKRGIKETFRPGAFTKDLIYLEGYEDIKAFLKQKGDLKRLYLGKVSLENLEEAEKLPNIRPARYLPEFLK